MTPPHLRQRDIDRLVTLRRDSALKQVKTAQLQLIAANGRQYAAREKLRKAVEEARKQHTLHEIGETLGMTRQGVYDLLKR